MAKLRLTQQARDSLMKLARKVVACPAEQKAVEKAYRAVSPVIRKIVEAKYPRKDMLVLKKYEKARIDDCICVQLTSGGMNQFNFESGTGPLTACNYCSAYPLDEKATDLFDNWKLAVDAHKEALEKKTNDYWGLVSASRTWEDVIEIWPEAAQIKPSSPSYSLTVLSADAIERIKADVALRQAA